MYAARPACCVAKRLFYENFFDGKGSNVSKLLNMVLFFNPAQVQRQC